MDLRKLLPKSVDLAKFLKQSDRVEAHKVHALRALQDKPTYQGTVAKAVVARRRAQNKAARRSRRINRLRGH